MLCVQIMRRVRARFITAITASMALAVGGSAWAAPLAGSEGLVTLSGNDAGASGSFSIDVAYEIFDGTSATDPLGATGSKQFAFVLKYNGDAGESPSLKVGRFSVFAPDPSSTTVPFYATAATVNPASAGQFLIGPSGNELDPFGGQATSSTPNIDPPPTGPNRVRFMFQTGLQQANFPATIGSGAQFSRLLVVSPAGQLTLPADIVLELDGTDTAPQIHADTIIHLVPEPGTLGLLGLGAMLLARRRASSASAV